MNDIEVYKQSEGFATELEIGDQLGVVDRTNSIYGLDFNHNQVFYEEVNSITRVQLDPAMDNRNGNLGGTVQP